MNLSHFTVETQKVERLMSFGNDVLHWLFFGYGHYLDIPMRVSTLRVLHTYRNQVPAASSRVDKFNTLLSRLMMLKIALNCIAGLQGLYAHTKELHKEAALEIEDMNEEDNGSSSNGETIRVAAVKEEQYPFDRSCVICCERIKGPSVIPCGHVFCWECIQTLARTGPSNLVSMKSLKCPYCSQICHVDMIRPLFFTTSST